MVSFGILIAGVQFFRRRSTGSDELSETGETDSGGESENLHIAPRD
jgi:hypothetical protein